MTDTNLDGRVFTVAANSAQGAVDSSTTFVFTEREGAIRATYSGGEIAHGSIVGRRISSSEAKLLYQCETVGGELRAGAADVELRAGERGLSMSMQWQWLTAGGGSGTSEYIEVPGDRSSLELLPWAERAVSEYLRSVESRPVFPCPDAVDRLAAFEEPLPERPTDEIAALRMLDEVGGPATVNQIGGRYYGFVNGGVHPPALAARWLADGWDQNAAMAVMSPLVERLESVCESWLADLLGLPEGTACGFVSGTSTSLVGAVATARDALLRKRGIDSRERGLFGQPELRVIVGGQAHAAARRALALTGLGSERVEIVPVDEQGRMDVAHLPQLDDTTLVLCQAGNVSTGSFDPVGRVCERAREAGAWVHVDGAFGLWAGAAPSTRHLYEGIEKADSWSTDAHKTLNAPYDSGMLFVRDADALRATLAASGSYFVRQGRDGMDYTVAMSRRARVVELWAILKTLGRSGVAQRIEQLCEHACLFRDLLVEHGFDVVNEVAFNQVLVRCRTPALTEATLHGVQSSGECWCGGSVWQNEPAIRISVCSWATTRTDVERSVAAFVGARDSAIAVGSA